MSDQVARLNAALEGRYRVECELGAGGMATVYLADDIKHERKVALKVLKPELAAIMGAERFLAEIKTTANLQHPHILPLHDSGEADGFLYYVMPYIEGETLRDRLNREKQLPTDEAVQIAKDIAEALDAAHEQGVIHRDIKPANILLSRGRPLVADFGIALAVSAAGGGRLTETGLSLGTPHYMSPEQAMGEQHVGPATDIYALGCALYEMLVGEPPYTGSTAQAILGKIIMASPDSVTEHRESVPANVEATIRRALERLPADRFSGAEDFARALADSAFRWGDPEPLSAGAVTASRWRAVAMAMTAVAVGSGAASWWAMTRETPDTEVRVQPIQPFVPGTSLRRGTMRFQVGLAPDGSGAMAILDSLGGTIRLKERHQRDGTLLPGSEGAFTPTFSPDGEWIAFFVGDDLRKIPRGGGAPITLASSARGPSRAIAWLDDGTIVTSKDGGLMRVSEDGGEPEILLRMEDAGGSIRRIAPLPDARGLLYLACQENCRTRSIQVFDMVSGERRLLVEDAISAWYAPTGHLLYVDRAGGVFAAPFDLESLEIAGPVVPVLDGVRPDNMWAEAQLSDDGTFMYLTGNSGGRQLFRLDRRGFATPFEGNWMRTTFAITLSPDGRRLAYDRNMGGLSSVWVKELPDGPEVRLAEPAGSPDWSPDGRLVVYATRVEGELARSVRPFDASAPSEIFVQLDRVTYDPSWSRDGRWFAYRDGGSSDLPSYDIRYLDLATDTSDHALLVDSGYGEWAPELSPDGQWLAYLSDQSGTPEVYVRPFPNVQDGFVKVSDGGGYEPAWAHSGDELFYRDAEDRLVAASVETEPTFRVLSREPLFDMGAYFPNRYEREYQVATDDQSFLMLGQAANGVGGVQVIRVENFFAELERKVPN